MKEKPTQTNKCESCDKEDSSRFALCSNCGTPMPGWATQLSPGRIAVKSFTPDPDSTTTVRIASVWLSIIFGLMILILFFATPFAFADAVKDPYVVAISYAFALVMFLFGVWFPTQRVRLEYDPKTETARFSRLRWPLPSRAVFVSLARAKGANIVTDGYIRSPYWDIALILMGDKQARIPHTSFTTSNRAVILANAVAALIRKPLDFKRK